MSDAPRPARDGETLSDEQCAKILRDIECDACQEGYILGKWPRTQDLIATRKLCATVAALRAQLGDAQRLAYRNGWNDATADAALTHTRQAQREWKMEQRYPRATRAASGEDASHV